MAAEDIIVISAMLMVVATGLLIVGYTGQTFSSNILSQPTINESSHAVEVYQAVDTVTRKFDLLFVATFIGFTLGLIILSWFIPAHPIFYIAYLLILIITACSL